MLPLQYDLLRCENALSYLWEPGSRRSYPYSVNDVLPVPHTRAQSHVPFPLRPSKTISPSPGSVIGQFITGSPTGSPDNLAVATNPTMRFYSSSSSASSSDSSPSLHISTFPPFILQAAKEGYQGIGASSSFPRAYVLTW
ncbi:hypothetical protein DL96DRAFT_1824780 [Flagelloscypha sp. PMI_526]|nr:hypothetical protein DL96DRAFT_1824780 [Flagelloscypha sp. PMI_526]